MDLTAGSLLASLFASSIGFSLYLYGKKQARSPQLIVGIVLMVFPYFIDGTLEIAAIAAALVGAMWLAICYGW